jgi:hypothetical protein
LATDLSRHWIEGGKKGEKTGQLAAENGVLWATKICFLSLDGTARRHRSLPIRSSWLGLRSLNNSALRRIEWQGRLNSRPWRQFATVSASVWRR